MEDSNLSTNSSTVPTLTSANASTPSIKTPESKTRMNKHCCVPGCHMKLVEFKGRKVSYHRFPRDPTLSQQWVEKIWGGADHMPMQFNRGLVCSLHFHPEERVLVHTCYPARYYLQIGVIPSIFPNTDRWMSLQNRSEIDASPSSKPTIIPAFKGPSMELQRWPPDIKLKVTDLNTLFVCTLCNGYFYNATTITECLHTFCKSCLVKHVDRSLHCPKCKILIHPTDPFVNMRHDSTMQDIMFRIFPDVEEEHQKSEEEFYVSRGLPWPPKEKEPEEPKEGQKSQDSHFAAVMLDYAGASSELGRFEPLQKHYLWIPDTTTIRHLYNFLKKKLDLPTDIQPHIFLGMNALLETTSIAAILDHLMDGSESSEDEEMYMEMDEDTNDSAYSMDFNEEEEVLELQYGLTKTSLDIYA